MRTLTGGTLPKALVMVAMGLTVRSAATELAAQGIPEEYTNLGILPQDISRQEIVSIMRGYAGAAGQSARSAIAQCRRDVQHVPWRHRTSPADR